jgi:hypothetical protein
MSSPPCSGNAMIVDTTENAILPDAGGSEATHQGDAMALLSEVIAGKPTPAPLELLSAIIAKQAPNMKRSSLRQARRVLH